MSATKKIYPAVCPEVILIACPIAPCTLFPQGYSGIVVIANKAYRLAYLMDCGNVVGYQLHGHNGTYDVSADLLSCDCPDATYRQRRCKHLAAVAQCKASGKVA